MLVFGLLNDTPALKASINCSLPGLFLSNKIYLLKGGPCCPNARGYLRKTPDGVNVCVLLKSGGN